MKDNIWFLPLRTVWRDNPDFFNLENAAWRVGDEIVMRGGTEDGTTDSYSPNANGSIPGYIYRPASGENWNHELYYEPMSQMEAATNDLAKCPSVIYPVAPRCTNDAIEVWWSSTYREDDMPSGIDIPSLVQRYAAEWPEPGEAPQRSPVTKNHLSPMSVSAEIKSGSHFLCFTFSGKPFLTFPE